MRRPDWQAEGRQLANKIGAEEEINNNQGETVIKVKAMITKLNTTEPSIQ